MGGEPCGPHNGDSTYVRQNKSVLPWVAVCVCVSVSVMKLPSTPLFLLPFPLSRTSHTLGLQAFTPLPGLGSTGD